MAKIHTVEWTTAILGHPALQIAMKANWWGLATERVKRLVGRVSRGDVWSGIPGSPPDHHAAPYAITEEFVSVYRMHPLLPDDVAVRSARTGELLETRRLDELVGRRARELVERVPLEDLVYSFAVAHPGAITLHNYPRALQQFRRDDGTLFDVGAIDVLRDRERGVPRYNAFRRALGLPPARDFAELCDDPSWAAELRQVYRGDIDSVDLLIGLLAERPPPGFGFSDTAFRIFILMASRRLKSDRFFTTDFTPECYTPAGMAWIEDNTMRSVLLRHCPDLAPALRGVRNAFAPWREVP
jgi:Animal haem peroxidase